MKRCFDKLAELVHDDHTIAEGLASFYQEAFFNLAKMITENEAKLPKRKIAGKQADHSTVTITVDNDALGSKGMSCNADPCEA